MCLLSEAGALQGEGDTTMDMMKTATEYAVQVNQKIQAGQHNEANDLLMVLSEKLSKACRVGYADAKSTIFFCMGR